MAIDTDRHNDGGLHLREASDTCPCCGGELSLDGVCRHKDCDLYNQEDPKQAMKEMLDGAEADRRYDSREDR